MPKQSPKTTPGDAFTPKELQASPKLPLGHGRISNVRAPSLVATAGGGGGSAGRSGGSGTVITISTTEGEYWKMHYPVHEPALSFGSGVRVFGRVANGWISGGRVEIVADAGEVEEVGIGEVIPLKAYSEGVCNTGTPTSTSAATAVGILQTSRRTATTTGSPALSLRIQILDATAEGVLTLWGPTATAANSAGWTPFSTALYITSARVSMFNGGVQISLTQSSTLLALPVSSSAGAGLRQHLLKTYPHTRLQLPLVVWPAAGVKLLFTLAEFSAHASSRSKSRKRVMGEPVVVSGYLSLILMGAELVLLFKRNMLFLGSWFVTTSALIWHFVLMLPTLTDETGTIPGTALTLSQKAWDSLLTPDLASKSIQELARLESQLAYTRFSFAVVWDSSVGVLHVCDVS
ncbi:unnamed protein product [Tuber aestivum]|uniref:Uncharacterized protein n=1 Tax=Tuber aestivum TaxID=59557 RepID=A0A292Q8W1_9PEZI|nr:unnamed protein product [Tuber aestivum]